MKLPNTIKAHVRSPEDNDFRSGWLEGEHIVVAFMTPEFADMLGKLFIQRAAISANPADEPKWIRAGVDLFSSSARASFLESPIHLVPVPKVDLPKSCADLDRHDQENVTPSKPAVNHPGRADGGYVGPGGTEPGQMISQLQGYVVSDRGRTGSVNP